MKKTFKFTFLFLVLAFSFSLVHLDALTCNPDPNKNIKIEKAGIKPTGWKANLPICSWSGPKGFNTYGGFSNWSDAEADAHTKTYVTFESADAKGTEGAIVEKCADPKREIEVTVTCTETVSVLYAQYYKYPVPCNEKMSSNYLAIDPDLKKDTTTCYNEGYTCNGAESSAGATCCPTGYEKSGGGCQRKESFTSTVKSSDVNANGGIKNATKGTGPNGSTVTFKSFSDAHSGGGWSCGDPDYALKCPKYECVKEYTTLDTCVPTYKLPDGSTAYCVNPGDGFNGEYQVDSEFDVNKCARSNSTIDCGYANILIESEYHRKLGETIDQEVVNLAMRLWGAHSGQKGYHKTGVANVAGCNCGEYVLFLTGEDGEIVNVYKYTKDYLKSNFEDIAYKYDYIPPNNGKLGSTTYDGKLGNLSCSNIGLTCGTGNACGKTSGGFTIYRQAIDLFFNTLIGNKEMKNHLNYLAGIESEPDDVNVVIGDKGENGERKLYLDISYDGDLIDLGLEEEVVYDCNELRNSTEITEEDKLKIYPYCQTIYYLVDAQGNRIKDSNGNVYDPIKVEECRKGSGCTTEEFSYALMCDRKQQQDTFWIKAYYTSNSAPEIIQKYISCASPTANQVMFGAVRGKEQIDSDPKNIPTDIYEKPKKGVDSKTFSVVVPCGDSGVCNETGTNKNDNFGSCAVKKNGNLTYTQDGTYTNYIKDPSLKCILNMSDSNKKLYDYSDHFGVNKNLCRVYCSDTVEYILANKINAVAGETFDYDIELAMYKEKKSDYHLSSVIREKRTCTSEIYYTKNFPADLHENIKSMYNLTDAEAEEAKNIGGLLSTLMTRSQNSEGGRKEVVNQVLFDLYNCNFYKDSFDSKIKTPKDSTNARIGKGGVKYDKTYDYASYLYGANNNYGLNKDCTLNKNGVNTCLNMTAVDYQFAAETDTGRASYINLEYAPDSARAFGIQNIQYCNNSRGRENCFEYVKKENGEPQDYNYNNNNNWSNNSNNTTMTLFGSSYTVPKNDYAMFEVYVDAGFYNKERFQTRPGSGKVINVTDGSFNNKYLTLDKFLYPISKNALTFDTNNNYCKTIDEDARSITKRCDVTQILGASELNNTKIYTFYRNQKMDQFFRDINSSDNRFTCPVDVKIPRVTSCDNCDITESTIYRNVNESKMFPNGVTQSSNWATAEGQIAANVIESTSDMIRTSDDLLDYSITLSTEQIKALREYNSNHKDYTSEEIANCIIVDNTYRNCRSNFLEILRGNTTELGSTQYGTLNPDYNGSKYFGNN